MISNAFFTRFCIFPVLLCFRWILVLVPKVIFGWLLLFLLLFLMLFCASIDVVLLFFSNAAILPRVHLIDIILSMLLFVNVSFLFVVFVLRNALCSRHFSLFVLLCFLQWFSVVLIVHCCCCWYGSSYSIYLSYSTISYKFCCCFRRLLFVDVVVVFISLFLVLVVVTSLDIFIYVYMTLIVDLFILIAIIL